MKHHLNVQKPDTKRGFVSVIALLFLIAVVLFILGKSLSMSGSKSLESQQHYDSVAALALAESGLELGIANITTAVNLNDSNFSSSCTNQATSNNITYGSRGGSFQFVPSTTVPSTTLCPIRVKGTVGTASRTLESQINFNSVIGVGGYGTSVTMTLKNPYNTSAIAVFNLAWRKAGSTNAPASIPGGNADATACTTCGTLWNRDSSSGQNAVGSLGSAQAVGPAGNASASATVTQTINKDRNYTEVGLILGGYSTSPSPLAPPSLKGAYSDKQDTANTSNQTTSYGFTPSSGEPGSNSNWCTAADTLVFGVSGRGNDDFTAAYTSVYFNTATPADRLPMTWVSHYPNTDGTSLGTYGDVFSEIWYIYNQYAPLMTVSGVNGNQITVNSTGGLKKGTLLKVYSAASTGVFNGPTRILNDPVGNTFTLDKTPSTALTIGATICSGTCALFNNPSSSGAKTQFSLTRSDLNTDQQWGGGFACYSGVDPSKIRRVSSSSMRLHFWHEVLSTDP